MCQIGMYQFWYKKPRASYVRHKLSPALIVKGVALALVVGLIGGLFPALRAARLPIVRGLYAS
jgi:ABC-type antimicrobial peptide transport system permease subunit